MEFVANKTDHEFHEFHENDHCHLDVIGLKYNFSQSLHDFLWDTDVHGFDGLTRSRSSRTTARARSHRGTGVSPVNDWDHSLLLLSRKSLASWQGFSVK
ncbi:MAG: hypothetical protein DMG09_01865 [Acidobacteria bacterium]|nr:MAG: hypothetical protein DMG09_01865 [Acidobacteriota bacterium]